MRVLILYENAGSGHRRAADIVAEALAAAPGVEVISGTGTDLLGVGGAQEVARLWNTLIAADQRSLADALINFGFRIIGLPLMEHVDGPKVHQRLDDIKPDVIVCTADGYAKVIGTYCNTRAVHHVQVITDIAIFLDLVHPQATHITYFSETAEAIQQLDLAHAYFQRALSIWRQISAYARNPRSLYKPILEQVPKHNGLHVEALGPLVDQRFSNLPPLAGAQNAAPRIAVIGGSIGGRFVVQTCQRLSRSGNFIIDAYCGNDEKSHATLKRLKLSGVRVHGFVADLPRQLRGCDAVVARPSAGVVLETLVLGIPIVMPRHTTANDRGSVQFVEHHALGAIYDRPRDLGSALAQVLRDAPGIRERQNRLCAAYPNPRSAQLARIRELVLVKKTGL